MINLFTFLINNTFFAPTTNNNQVATTINYPFPFTDTESNLEKACKATPTSFREALPNYCPNEQQFTIKIITEFFSSLTTEETIKISTMNLLEEIKKLLSNSETIIERAETLISKIVERENIIKENLLSESLGEISFTLNEAAYYLTSTTQIDLPDDFSLKIAPLKLVYSGFLFYKVVNTYAKIVCPISTLSTFTSSVKRQMWLDSCITVFILLYAPPITYGLFKPCNQKVFESILENWDLNSGNYLLEKSILGYLFIPKKNNLSHISIRNIHSNHNKNNKNNFTNKANFLKIIINIIIILLLLYFLIDFNYLLKIIVNLKFSQVLKFYILMGSLVLIYKLIDFYIFILVLRGKIKIPLYLPSFLFKWLHKKEQISKYNANEIRAFLDLHVKFIISHIIALSIIILFSSYL